MRPEPGGQLDAFEHRMYAIREDSGRAGAHLATPCAAGRGARCAHCVRWSPSNLIPGPQVTSIALRSGTENRRRCSLAFVQSPEIIITVRKERLCARRAGRSRAKRPSFAKEIFCVERKWWPGLFGGLWLALSVCSPINIGLVG